MYNLHTNVRLPVGSAENNVGKLSEIRQRRILQKGGNSFTKQNLEIPSEASALFSLPNIHCHG